MTYTSTDFVARTSRFIWFQFLSCHRLRYAKNSFEPMKRLMVGCFALFVSCSGVFALSASDQEARDAALSWLAMVDAGQYAKAYVARPPRIKSGGTEEQFIRGMRAWRYPLGRPRSREFLKVVHKHQLLGSPDGDYQLIGFKTSFEHKATAAEAVVVT